MATVGFQNFGFENPQILYIGLIPFQKAKNMENVFQLVHVGGFSLAIRWIGFQTGCSNIDSSFLFCKNKIFLGKSKS